MGEKLIGKVTHFFGKISVAVIKLEDGLKKGDKLKFAKGEESFEQVVSSMQVEHKEIEEAKKGDEIGMKTDQAVTVSTEVFKVEE